MAASRSWRSRIAPRSPPVEDLDETLPSTVAESSRNGARNARDGEGLKGMNPQAIEWRIDVQEGHESE